jgi:hypothetical protein
VTFNDELGQLPPDLDLGTTANQLMRRGRHIRRLRQSSVAGAAAIAVVGVMASGAAFAGGHHPHVVQTASGGIAQAASSPSGSPRPASSPTPAHPSSADGAPGTSPVASSVRPSIASSVAPVVSSSTASCSPAAQADAGAPPATVDGNPPAWGTLTPAGTDSGKSVVLYGFHISDAAIPCTHFGLMLGTADSTGIPTPVTGEYATNESEGSDLEPGMHAVSLSGGGNQISAWYLLGYYVGNAASVSVEEKSAAAPVAATVVPWSVNPDVKFWWVSGTGAVPNFGPLAAKDAKGTALPIGPHGQIGVG